MDLYNIKNRQTPKQTTCGWSLLVQWKDGSINWVPLKDLKELNLLQVTNHAIVHKLTSEPAFAWWVPFTLKKRERFICAAPTQYEVPDWYPGYIL
jgi:hypothetical protein